MRRKTTTEFEIAVMSRLDAIEQRQSQPRVNGWWSGLVAASPEAVAGVSIALASVPISMVGAGAGAALKMSPDACLQIGGLICGAGAGFGVLCLGAGAIDLVEIVDNLSGRYFDYRERRDERKAQSAIEERLVPYRARDKATKRWDYYSAEYADRTLVIREETDALDAIKWTYAKLWHFIEDCFKAGEWSRRKVCERWGSDMTQGQHKAVSDFLHEKAPGLWGLKGEKNRPALEAWLRRFRWSPTDQPTSQPINQE